MKKTDTYIAVRCNGIFAQYIEEYVGLKRTFGFKYNLETTVLNNFDAFCVRQNLHSTKIISSFLSAWESKLYNENETSHKLRVRVVRGFLSYLSKKGICVPNNFHPLPNAKAGFVPYIFSRNEIANFINAVDKMSHEKVAISPIRHLVMPVLFRMIYGCGLREAEATHLKKKDIAFEDRTVRIINSKGDYDRIVVMSESLTNICYNYYIRDEIKTFESEYFFPSPDHTYYSNSSIYDIFRKALFIAGIYHKGRGKGPRLHDLRHTYAVHVLSKWQKEGKDLYVCLPILSDYLGHKNITSTERYVQLVPESYIEVTDAYDTMYDNIFPEVEV